MESSDVEKIINLDILVKDFEQELKNVFPKNKELRRKSVLLFRLLLKKQLTQTEIGKTLFTNNKITAVDSLMPLKVGVTSVAILRIEKNRHFEVGILNLTKRIKFQYADTETLRDSFGNYIKFLNIQLTPALRKWSKYVR